MMSTACPGKSILKNPRTSGGYTYFPYVKNESQGEESILNHFQMQY